MITVCVPTLRRYDLLEKLIESGEMGALPPDKYLIVDNGGGLNINQPKVEIYKPGRNLGVAASWNWLIKNSNEIRIICNDDIEFHNDTIFIVARNYDEKYIIYPGYTSLSNIYSFFTISDYIVNLVGYFDESISPGYAYFEDNDYDWRLKNIRDKVGKLNIDYLAVRCGYNHSNSSTIKSFSESEMKEHHRKFVIARDNFRRKWGRLP